MGSTEPSQSGVYKHKGTAAGGRPGPAPSRGGGVRASEGTNPCTRPSFATKNVFDVLQDLSESIGGSPGPQLDAADGQPEPIVHDLHQSLVELLERPEILSLHAVRRPMRPTGGGIFFERTSVFERRFGSSNEDSNSKTVFALIAIQLNPIESKLLGRIAAKAQQQQRAQQIDRRLPQTCARKMQICARETQICARKKGFFCFFN